MTSHMPDARSIEIDLSTISTPKDQLLSVVVNEPVSDELLQTAKNDMLDRIAVFDANGGLAGFIRADQLELHQPIRQDQLQHVDLLGKHVVAIEQLLDMLATDGVVTHGPDPEDRLPAEWFGVVTGADLNRPLFRASVYTVIARFESAYGHLVSEFFGDDWEAINKLNDHSQNAVRERFDQFKKDGIHLSPIVNCSLDDLFWIARRTPELSQRLGYADGDAIEPDQNLIGEIRNRIMHPVQPLIPRGGDEGQQDISDLRDTITKVMDLTRRVVGKSESQGS